METEEHPEAKCNDCGNPNPTWYAPNYLWNKVMPDRRYEIICPACFQKKADAMSINLVFKTELLESHKTLANGN